jgi:hypothetical protein
MNIPVAHMLVRMKRLSPWHRTAHLRALIRREPAGSTRTPELVALLRDQLAVSSVYETRAT